MSYKNKISATDYYCNRGRFVLETMVQNRLCIKKEILVSIPMLVYNHEQYLRQALDSILMQKVNFSYEIVVGEDASSDASREILLGYKQRYPEIFKLILHKENVGIGENSKSRRPYLNGKYIAPIEGDDFWLDEYKLQKQVDFLEKNLDFSAVAHRFITVDEFGEVMDRDYRGIYCQDEYYTIEHFQNYIMASQTATMMCRNYKYTIGESGINIYDRNSALGDRKMNMVSVLSGKVFCMPEIMSAYRIHFNSWSSNTRYGGTSCYIYHETFDLQQLAKDLFEKHIDFTEIRMRSWYGTVIWFLKQPNYMNWNALISVFQKDKDQRRKILFIFTHTLGHPIRCLRRVFSRR